jgi:NADPH:quinone reductase-like Zn-dependent oxidoreductase
MKAAVVHEIGGTPRMEEIAAPAPGEGQVLVRVLAAPINAVDKQRVAGTHYSRPEFPAVAGWLGAGELGDGRRVLFMNMDGGSMAEQVAVDPARLIPVPDGLDPAVAAAAFNPGMSAWWAVHERGPVQPGSRVLIQGATGATGKLAVQLARLRGAGFIVATGRNPATLGELRELGADATIRIDQPDEALAQAYRSQEGDGWDLIIDYLWGHPTEVLIHTLIRHDAEGRSLHTRLVEVGAMAGPDLMLPAAVLRSAGLEIVGMGTGTGAGPMGRERIQAAIAEFYELLRTGAIRVDIDRVPLEQVADVWHREQGGRRFVITPCPRRAC